MSFETQHSDPDDLGSSEDKTYVLVVHGLYLASLVVGITSIVGLVVAYVKRGEAPAWAQTHYTYAIRTFWIGLLYGLIGLLLSLVAVGLLVLLATAIWFIVRVVISLVRATEQKPMTDPTTWLV